MPESDELQRINALTTNARNTWLALLGVLVFISITLMGVKHIDFYGVGRGTELPLIGIEVPTRFFFVAAPVLLAAMYGYFHLYLIRLWDVLGVAEPKPGGKPLGDVISPWLVTDAALQLRARRRNDGCVTPRQMDLPAMALNILLAWGFGWAVLAFAWWMSMPGRTLWLTSMVALCLLVTLAAGAASFAMMLRRMGPESNGDYRLWNTVPFMAGLLIALVAVIPLTYLRVEGGSGWLANVNLVGARLVARPDDWLDRSFARKELLAHWCKRERIDCDPITEKQAGDFEVEWTRRRQNRIAGLSKPDIVPLSSAQFEAELSDPPEPVTDYDEWSADIAAKTLKLANDERAPNLRGVDLREAFLTGVNLSGVRLQDALLHDAYLEEAKLIGAQMQGADLHRVQMQGADLRWAQMQGAGLFGAQMQGANLRWAQMEGADLTGARMQGANLRWAQMEEANLSGAQMQGVDLRWAQMQGAGLFGAQMQRANLRWAQMEGADLRRAQMQEAYLYRAQMQGAQMQGAELIGAQMQGADISYALLGGEAGVTNIGLYLTNLSGVTIHGTAIQFADLSEAITDLRTDFRNSFGDGSATLPSDIIRPCQWAEQVLDEATFMARWRGWVESNLAPLTLWEFYAPEGYENVVAILPPAGCKWNAWPLLMGP